LIPNNLIESRAQYWSFTKCDLDPIQKVTILIGLTSCSLHWNSAGMVKRMVLQLTDLYEIWWFGEAWARSCDLQWWMLMRVSKLVGCDGGECERGSGDGDDGEC